MIIKPLGEWAKEFGVPTQTLKKWLVEECNLHFQSTPEHRVSQVEKCYVDRVWIAVWPSPGRLFAPERRWAMPTRVLSESEVLQLIRQSPQILTSKQDGVGARQ